MTALTGCAIGVDVGGTHTDVQVAWNGRLERGKALTDYTDFSRGLLRAIEVAAEKFDVSLEHLLAHTDTIFNATTVVTNAISEFRGDRVGVLVTAGFKDTFRLSGGPRLAEFDDHLQVNVPDLVDRRAIIEIGGRMSAQGAELVPLDPAEVDAAVDTLVLDRGVDALAVCLLSSYANPAHEQAVEQRVRERHPGVFVSSSHRLFPVMRETRRWTTAVLNSFVQSTAETYLDTINRSLAEHGFAGTLAFFQGLGAGITQRRAKEFPLSLLASGPAAGAMGANALARTLATPDILLGDMGGTSFDTCLIRDNEVRINKNLDLGQLQTGLNLVDVVSIGAGGGSIAWVSERGVPQVGPRSARSTPGPACYGRGGEEPTVTDAMVCLGVIDPGNYLGGRTPIYPDLADAAIQRGLGEHFGWSTEESAVAVHDLVVANMSNAIREVSVRKGHDPRRFTFLAFGGTLPMFAWQIAQAVGMSEVIIPANSSVFCAQGLLHSDFAIRRDHSLFWSLDDPSALDSVNAATDAFVTQAVADMVADGFDLDQLRVKRYADLKYPGQVYELTIAMPERITADALDELRARFLELYESTYGEGTAWTGAAPIMQSYTVAVSTRREAPQMFGEADSTARAQDGPPPRRRVFLPETKQWQEIPVVPESSFASGDTFAGPLIVDATDTTVYVPTGVVIGRDKLANYRLTAAQEGRS
ncbi:hypothetical protein Aple_022720 [Acrocarpospora pleiomorpha]|uniref:5-oxoprolinase n=1 Tax=Acrocarpospora pleiomorpha TaxID=90975 RepID=A0A5M3XFE8_9ACTN|nr:hydantoinase/oxoprolinase family protein [Acrocarpospora pleiomorpha]GES19376.1 hypothetical protein Aple_022720 [Acrocarpospora pleiomorpha]